MPRLDHLVVLTPELSPACALVERATGLKPVYGGKHGSGWTENAVLPIEGGAYLEILAPTEVAPTGEDPWVDDARALSGAALYAWCVQVPGALDDVAGKLNTAKGEAPELSFEGPCAWSRTRADGVVLNWSLIELDRRAFGGAAPFFIDWLGSEHPSTTPGPSLTLRQFVVGHPQADLIATFTPALEEGPAVRLGAAPAASLFARIEGPAGALELTETGLGEAT